MRDDDTASETSAASLSGAQAERCPICGDEVPLYCTKRANDADWHIHRCVACGHGFVSNRPSAEMLAELYAQDQSHHPTNPDGPSDTRIGFIERLAKLAHVRGDALDVGSGGAEFSLQLQRKGFRPVMIDLDPRAEQAARHVPGGEFHRASFEAFAYPYPFGAIVMSQVLEHALDPIAWLRKARQMLKPGGVVAVSLPNFNGLYRSMGERDPFLIPPRHLNYFTAKSLRSAFEQARLKPLVLRSNTHLTLQSSHNGFARRTAVSLCNLLGPMLNPTTRGIMLHGYARRTG